MLMEIERFAKPKKTRAFCVCVCSHTPALPHSIWIGGDPGKVE